jgi:proton-dependent oligopeptide transporter, POT family
VYLSNQDKLPTEALPTASAGQPLQGIAGYVIGVPLGIVVLLWLLTLPPLVPITVAVVVLASGIAWLARLPAHERPQVVALTIACLLTAAYWAVYEQQGNTLQIWADESTHWPTVFGFTIPSTWYQAFNPFAIWIFVPLLNALWAWQARRGNEPGSLSKMALGCVITGAGFIVLVVAAGDMAPGAKSSVMWLVVSTAIFTIGEIYLSPIGLSFVTKVAPARLMSMMMGVWYLASFIGNYATGYLGSFYETMPHAQFFWLMTAIGVGAGAVLWAMNKPLKRVLVGH